MCCMGRHMGSLKVCFPNKVIIIISILWSEKFGGGQDRGRDSEQAAPSNASLFSSVAVYLDCVV